MAAIPDSPFKFTWEGQLNYHTGQVTPICKSPVLLSELADLDHIDVNRNMNQSNSSYLNQ